MQKSDIIKMKVSTYRALTIDMLKELCTFFEQQDEYCKSKKVKISEVQIEAFFKMLDTKNSNDLEYEEVI